MARNCTEEASTLGNGKLAKSKVWASIQLRTETLTQANGKATRVRAMGFRNVEMEVNTAASIETI